MNSAQEPVYPNPDRPEDNRRRAAKWWNRPPDAWTDLELEAQKAAREAITQLWQEKFLKGHDNRLDELEVLTRMNRRLGPGGLAVMAARLLYWFTRPALADRWWIYKTVENPKDGKSKGWHDERGLNRKQVRKAIRAGGWLGLFRVREGRRRKPYYCLDWIRMAEVLGVPVEYPEGFQSGTPKGGSLTEWYP